MKNNTGWKKFHQSKDRVRVRVRDIVKYIAKQALYTKYLIFICTGVKDTYLIQTYTYATTNTYYEYH